MVELARWARGEPSSPTTSRSSSSCARSSGRSESALPRVFAEAPLVLESDLVVCSSRPTTRSSAAASATSTRASSSTARAPHSARPWLGVNAIDLAVEGLAAGARRWSRSTSRSAGSLFLEVLSVDPDPRRHRRRTSSRLASRRRSTTATRPDRTPREAEARLRELVGARRGDHPNSPAGPRRAGSPLVERLRDVGRASRSQPKQAWTNVADFAARRASTRSTSARARRATRTRADEQVEIAELERDLRGAAARSSQRLASDRAALPRPRRARQYPFARLDDWQRRGRRRGVDADRLRPSATRARSRPRSSARRSSTAIDERSSYPRAAGLPELRQAIAAWIDRRYRRRASTRTSRSSRRSGRRRRSSRSRRSRSASAALVAVPEPGYPVYERGALFAGAHVVTVPLREETGWLPDLDAFDALGRAGALLGLLPEQPDRRDRAARRSTRSWPGSRASTASCSAPTRPTPSSGSTSRPRRRSRSPTARTSSSSTRSRSARR